MIFKLASNLTRRRKAGNELDGNKQLSDLNTAIAILNSRIDRLEQKKEQHDSQKINSELEAFYDVRFQLIHEHRSIRQLGSLFGPSS